MYDNYVSNLIVFYSFTVEIYVSCITIGAALYGSVPLFYEMACESVYPISESAVSGLLTLLNNGVGVLLYCVLSIPHIGEYRSSKLQISGLRKITRVRRKSDLPKKCREIEKM